jgi:hypothetical protein
VDTEIALRTAVERWLPADAGTGEPAWSVLVLPNTPSAPIVSISRDPRSGPRLTPVFFVGLGEPRHLLPIGQRMFEETRVGRLVHMVEASPESAFLVIPALYHLEDIEEFSAAVERHLASLRLDSLAWQHEQCEVLITHRGQSYHARLDPDGNVTVDASAAT